ncbi:energy transducer TonB [Gracilimonas halophila]|uniref:Energy transducer TonB n=1 Tax=Gracilimonas halophila TaxID=1834464 RepID=A0ABW5JGI0_9BACT
MKLSRRKIDLRKNYPIFFELGLIGALLISIAAFRFHLPSNSQSSSNIEIKEEPPVTLSPITIQKKPAPPPVLARIPVEIPNDDPIDPPAIDFADFNDPPSALDLPPETDDSDELEVLEIAEFMPKMEGGLEALYNDIKYPELAKRNGIEGIVIAEFIITEKGKIEDLKIVRGIGGGCDEEVLRVIKLQSFTPGIQNGNLVKVRMKQVVHFRLQR